MQEFIELISRSEDWLVDQTIDYARRYGYMPYTSTLVEAWRASICGLSGPLIKALTQYEDPPQLTADEHNEESITAFGIEAARRHRSRGITLGRFMGLMKYYRQSYIDLIDQCDLQSHKHPRYREFTNRFFDRLEIGFCSEWASQNESNSLLEAQEKNVSLTHEKNKYLTIFESLRDPVVLLDRAGRIDNTNQAANSLFGGSTVPGAGYYGSARLPLLEGELENLIAQDGEHLLQSSLGLRCFDVKAKNMLDVSEKFAGTVLIFSDVTDSKQAQLLAEQANKTKSAFLAAMSHEIRTPIMGIVGMTALLHETKLDDAQISYVNAITTSGEILSSLISDILDYSKIEAGVLELESSAFTLKSLLGDVLILMASAASAKGLLLSAEIDEKLPVMVRSDFNKLRQILLNLVNNAVKFTELGTIVVRAEIDGTSLRFVVSDSGIGISESGQTHLFNAFVQADRTIYRRFGGTGLGLAICRKLVTALGGEIGMQSKINQGSVFWFQIPMDEVAQANILPAVQRKECSKALNILLVEDNEINRIVACGLLARSGHSVITEGSGSAALTHLEHKQFDIVLMDLSLPGISGLETIYCIRTHANEAIARTPILVVSALVTKDDIAQCLNAGANAFLGKPYKPDLLEETIRATLSSTEYKSDVDHQKIPLQGVTMDPAQQLNSCQLQEHAAQLGLETCNRIVAIFVDTVPALLATALHDFRAGRQAHAVRAAHRIKSSAATLGLRQLADLAGSLEIQLEKNSVEPTEQLFAQLEHSLPQAIHALQTSLDMLFQLDSKK